MSFGKNLQYLRQLSKNMTQEALADKLNVSRQTISKWEMDTANPEMDKALEICRIFNCSLDNLFREEMEILSATESTPMMPLPRRSSVSRAMPWSMASLGRVILISLPL